MAAGASAVIIFNEGSDEGRMGLINGTLSSTVDENLPVVATSFDDGLTLAMLAEGDDERVHVMTATEVRTETSQNVLAETPTGDDDNVVMAGAHLDSVPEGPGINDNGSGSAALLEVALDMAELGVQPENKVRFAWLGSGGVQPDRLDRLHLR